MRVKIAIDFCATVASRAVRRDESARIDLVVARGIGVHVGAWSHALNAVSRSEKEAARLARMLGSCQRQQSSNNRA
jgi:hypothetical protein